MDLRGLAPLLARLMEARFDGQLLAPRQRARQGEGLLSLLPGTPVIPQLRPGPGEPRMNERRRGLRARGLDQQVARAGGVVGAQPDQPLGIETRSVRL